MVKNEEDIIEQFFRHNLKYLDLIYVLDHYSTDKTVDIIKSMQREGLPIYFIEDIGSTSIEYRQSEIMTRIFHNISKINGAGIYFPIDADEFINSGVRDFISIKREIAELGDNIYFKIFWDGLIIPESPDPEYFSDPPKSFNLMQRHESGDGQSKIVLSISDSSVAEKIIIEQGNHSLCHEGVLQEVCLAGLSYLHAPIRSTGQMFRKAVSGWLSNVHRYGAETAIGNHWGFMFRQICQQESLNNSDLKKALNHYSPSSGKKNQITEIDSNSIFDYQMRYSHMRTSDIKAVLTDLEERFIHLHKRSSTKASIDKETNIDIFGRKISANIRGIGQILIFPQQNIEKNDMAWKILNDGVCDIFITSIIVKFLRNYPGNLIDVGSEVGWYSYISAKLMPKFQIFSFEENETKRKSLDLGAKMNHLNNIHIIDTLNFPIFHGENEKFDEYKEKIPVNYLIVEDANIKFDNMYSVQSILKRNQSAIMFVKTKIGHANIWEKILQDPGGNMKFSCFFANEKDRTIREFEPGRPENGKEKNEQERYGYTIFAMKGTAQHDFLKAVSR
ncbi:glycosyltransferase family 2 protein [Azospirillum agricola]|uniref:glycosyltransferase family 2 protein n=1 Tax=Azospirillum agricola TaxID=1720247 RepID=UPI0015C4E03E|nr:glycosyltransferase family 2 protein [Azospirillum agricola]